MTIHKSNTPDRQTYLKRLNNDLAHSATFSETNVMPIIAKQLLIEDYICCENANPETETELYNLDREYGADFIGFLKGSDKPVLFSTRVLNGFQDTITMRAISYTGEEVELDKRRKQFASGELSKSRYFTVQAFINKEQGILFDIYVVKTADLVDYIDAGHKHQMCVNKEEGNVFAAMKIDDLRAAGVKVAKIVITDRAAFEKELLKKYRTELRAALASISK